MGRRKPCLRDSQGERPAFQCHSCLGGVYPGEPMFDWDNRRICVDCFKVKVNAWMDGSPTQVAAALGFAYGEAV